MSEIIAKAMNSTLGTENFMAFDKLMRLKTVTSSDASDPSFAYIPEVVGKSVVYETNFNGTGDSTIDWSSGELIAFKSTLQGEMSIIFDVEVRKFNSGASQQVTGIVTLYRNGEQVASVNNLTTDSNYAGSKTASVTFLGIPIGLGDTIAIVMGVAYVDTTPVSDTKGSITVTTPISLRGNLTDYVPIIIQGEV